MDIVQILTLIGVIVAIFGVPWYLRGHFAKMEKRLINVENKINELIRSNNTLAHLSGVLVNLLHKNKVMGDEDFEVVTGAFTTSLQVKEIYPNPITIEEKERLNNYIRKARKGGRFTIEEVEDYNDLVSELQHERPDDSNIWPLVSLGAFLLGLYFGTKRRDQR